MGNGVILIKRDGMVEAPSGPHGDVLAFLSDLDEQVEIQLSVTTDPALLVVLTDIRSRIASAGLTVSLLEALAPRRPAGPKA
jgi:hypothetical protein